MPAASWRTRPARTISLWLIASASAGTSRSVGMSDRLQRIEATSRPPRAWRWRAAPCRPRSLPESSEEAEESDPIQVVVHRVDHQEHQETKAHLLGDLPLSQGERPTQYRFEDEEEQVPAVQHGDRQEIEEEEVDADHRREEGQARDALTRLLARRDGDLDGASDVLPVELADHDLVEPDRREDRHLDRAIEPLSDRLNWIRSDEAEARSRADPDAPDLDLLAVGTALLDRVGYDGDRERLGAPLDLEPRRLAGALLDPLGQLVPRQHGLPLEGRDDVAPLEPHFLGGKPPDEIADRRWHVGPRSEVPRLALVAKEIARLRQSRRDPDCALAGRALYREREHASLTVLRCPLHVFPVLDGTSVDGG